MKSLEEENTQLAAAPPVEALRLTGKRVVAVLYSTYPSDPRPRRAAEALAREGASVEVICLKESDGDRHRAYFNGVAITRVSLRRSRGGKLSYLFQYALFILISGAILACRALRQRYDLVHVHNMPDALVFSALVPKILGARIILDLHDPMPELITAIFRLREDSGLVRLLKKVEKLSLRFADAAVTANEAFRRIFAARSCPSEKIMVILNSPDEEIFKYRRVSKKMLGAGDSLRPFVIMYHGSLVERHGLDLAVAALSKVRAAVPRAELHIYGRRTPFLEQVMDSVRESGLGDVVRHLGPKNLEQIAQAIGDCDVGIIPNRRSRFTEVNLPTRIFEYLSQGKPVIAPRTPGILDYFSEEELVLFELGNADDLATKLAYIFSNRAELVEMVERGQEVYRAHRWSSERRRFVNLAFNLLNPNSGIRLEGGEP